MICKQGPKLSNIFSQSYFDEYTKALMEMTTNIKEFCSGMFKTVIKTLTWKTKQGELATTTVASTEAADDVNASNKQGGGDLKSVSPISARILLKMLPDFFSSMRINIITFAKAIYKYLQKVFPTLLAEKKNIDKEEEKKQEEIVIIHL